MKITALTVDDYKRVRHVKITPDADTNVILIGGRNRQGKSTTLDAISAAFGGAKAIAADPVRHGAEHAEIRIELDGGALVVERTIEPSGTTQLVVRDADGPVRRPQELLDRLVGARFLDPLAFTRMRPGDQRAALMRVIPGADEINKLDERRDRAFTNRTNTGRDLARARGEMERLPPPPDGAASKPIDVVALVAEQRAFADQQRAGDGLGNVVSKLIERAGRSKADEARAAGKVADLENALAQARVDYDRQTADVVAANGQLEVAQRRLAASADAWAESAPRRAELERDLARAGEHNSALLTHEIAVKRRAETVAAVDKLAGEVDKLSAAIKSCDARKAEVLAAAKLPVDGLELAEDGIRIAGVPFAQAAASEQIRVALALAIAGSPELDDVWVRDGALLDEESLDLVAQHAAAAGKRVWIERVGTRDPGVIVINDGKVAP